MAPFLFFGIKSEGGICMTSSQIPWFGWPSLPLDVTGWLNWPVSMPTSPHALNQAINPGWNFGPVVNIGNSSAPQVEVEVLQRHSYGRQLGRLSDVMAVLVARLSKADSADPDIRAFIQMKSEIDQVKLEGAANRLTSFQADLVKLKLENPAQYQEIKKALRVALDL
jgi:hypothetical protein